MGTCECTQAGGAEVIQKACDTARPGRCCEAYLNSGGPDATLGERQGCCALRDCPPSGSAQPLLVPGVNAAQARRPTAAQVAAANKPERSQRRHTTKGPRKSECGDKAAPAGDRSSSKGRSWSKVSTASGASSRLCASTCSTQAPGALLSDTGSHPGSEQSEQHGDARIVQLMGQVANLTHEVERLQAQAAIAMPGPERAGCSSVFERQNTPASWLRHATAQSLDGDEGRSPVKRKVQGRHAGDTCAPGDRLRQLPFQRRRVGGGRPVTGLARASPIGPTPSLSCSASVLRMHEATLWTGDRRSRDTDPRATL